MLWGGRRSSRMYELRWLPPQPPHLPTVFDPKFVPHRVAVQQIAAQSQMLCTVLDTELSIRSSARAGSFCRSDARPQRYRSPIAALVLPADWLPGPSYLQALFSWFWFRSSTLFSFLEGLVQRQEPGQSERERLKLAPCLPAQLWLQPLLQAKTAFGEKRRVIGFLHSWQSPFEWYRCPLAEEATGPEELQQVI
jgi:hypothetical protein